MATVERDVEDDDTIHVTFNLGLPDPEEQRAAFRLFFAGHIVAARKGDVVERRILLDYLRKGGRPDLYGLVVPGGSNPQADDAITQRLVDAIMEFADTLEVKVVF